MLTTLSQQYVLCFYCVEHVPDSPAPFEWELTDVAFSSQLGSEERVRNKRMKVEAAIARHQQQQQQQAPPQAQPQANDLEQQGAPDPQQQPVIEQQQQQQPRQEAGGREDGADQRLREAEQQLRDSQQRERELQQQLQESQAATQNAIQATADADRRVQELTENLQQREAELEAANARVQQVQRELVPQARAQEAQWIIERGEIQLTEEEKGRGGWAVVRVANFRGLRVAAKCLHEQIREYYRDLFIREMNISARLRHPNLVQFVGATLQGEMIILSELMPTSLRAVLEQRAISHDEITSISLDVARALNYLHLTQPEPLIHRDISSANVLLEPGPNNSWKAKVSDYGSVNLQRQLRTIGPGSPVYAAPEANTTDQQSPKMDIFSFGVLLIEMCTARFPEVATRQVLITTVAYPHFVELIGRCMSREIGSRPSASEIITQLTALN